MQLLLVRHGHAGSKARWHGDDRLRPLTPQGMAEAEQLVGMLASLRPGRIVSSPYLRCVQTITPLADALGLSIEHSEDLVPSAGDAAEALARQVTDDHSRPVVLCTHGEVIHYLQGPLGRDTRGLFGRGRPRAKGSVWVLDRRSGKFTGGRYIPQRGAPRH